MLGTAVDPRDLVTKQDNVELRRYYFEFLGCVISNDLAGVLASARNAAQASAVLEFLIGGCTDATDVKTQKVCFGALGKLTVNWLKKDGGGPPEFGAYVASHVIPTCFGPVFGESLDLNDAWAVWVVDEIANVLRGLYFAMGMPLCQHLESVYFPSIQLPQALATEFLQVLAAEKKGENRDKALSKQLQRMAAQVRELTTAARRGSGAPG